MSFENNPYNFINETVLPRSFHSAELDTYHSYRIGDFYLLEKSPSLAEKHTGWKFYVSIDERDLEKGFNLISQIAFKHHCPLFKVLAKGVNCHKDQQGKTIVFYDTGTENWSRIIPEIEKSLRSYGIQPHMALKDPSKNINKDRRISNSLYVMYGNDQDSYGRYISAWNRKTYNDSGKADPFLGIQVDRYKTDPKSQKPLALENPQKYQQQSSALFWLNERNWKTARTMGGEMIDRLPVKGLSSQEINFITEQLRKANIPTVVRESALLGPTIRVTGVMNIQKLKRFLKVQEQQRARVSAYTQMAQKRSPRR